MRPLDPVFWVMWVLFRIYLKGGYRMGDEHPDAPSGGGSGGGW